MATIPRKPKVRPYAKDYLTKPEGGHYAIQFRVPAHLKGTPPFGDKSVYKKSTGTSDRRQALAIKDAFLNDIDFFGQRDREDQASLRGNPTHHYFTAYNSIHGSFDELLALKHTLEEYAHGDADSHKASKRYEAQIAAVERKIEELVSSPYQMAERPHAYSVTLSEMSKRKAEEMALRSLPAKTIGKLTTATRRYLEYAQCDPGLSDINRPRVKGFLSSIRDTGQSQATTGNDLSYLSQVFAFAQDNGFLTSNLPNPFRGHRLDGFQEGIPRERFSTEQIVTLLRASQSEPDLAALIYVGHYTGMRLNEAFQATLFQQQSGWLWDVAKRGGKTRAATRQIPVHPKLLSSLTELSLWSETGNSLAWKSKTSNGLGKRFNRLKEKAFPKAPSLVFHSFRHGFITQLVSAGYHDLEFADLSGHSTSTANTEGGRTYLRRQNVAKHWEMIHSLTILPSPLEIFGATNFPQKRL